MKIQNIDFSSIFEGLSDSEAGTFQAGYTYLIIQDLFVIDSPFFSVTKHNFDENILQLHYEDENTKEASESHALKLANVCKQVLSSKNWELKGFTSEAILDHIKMYMDTEPIAETKYKISKNKF